MESQLAPIRSLGTNLIHMIQTGSAPNDKQRESQKIPMSRKNAPSAAAPAGLPSEAAQARRFGKTRAAMASARLEDYTELIDDLLATQGEARPTDIARRLGVSHPTAIKAISRLKRDGLATSRPYRGIFLTDAGHQLAARVRRRHRLVVDVLCAIGVPPEAAEADAEGIEHHVSTTTIEAFAKFLGARG
jgi:DtxR family manganese transport transcriptional regulator